MKKINKLNESELKQRLRILPDWPKKGVNFVDITTLLKDPVAFRDAIDLLSENFAPKKVDVVVGIEARGFMLGAPVAYNLGVGFVPARKSGKLPFQTMAMEYTLEYSSEYLEMHKDGIMSGQKVAIVDDLLATGGTALATARLVEKLGGIVGGCGFLVELDFLKGRDKLPEFDLFSLIHYDS